MSSKRKRKPLNAAQRKRKYETLKRWREENPWQLNLRMARERCNNKNHDSYSNYGGRGLKCTLTLEEIKKLWFRDKAFNLKTPSLDREHEDDDYTFATCKFIEMRINAGLPAWKKKLNRESPELSTDGVEDTGVSFA